MRVVFYFDIQNLGDEYLRQITYLFMKKSLKSGCWHYDVERMHLCFNPDKNHPEITEYVVDFDHLSTSTKLLDIILQMQRKGRWSERGEGARNNHGQWQCDDYQIWDFIELVDQLCVEYLKTNIQGAFSPFGENREIDWDKLVSKKAN